MAKKVKLTRPEFKRYRDELTRFQRYLPMLKLKQQQLQLTMREVSKKTREAEKLSKERKESFERYQSVLGDISGINLKGNAKPVEVKTSKKNIAGVTLPILDDVIFPEINYSLFGTPAWVDQTLADLREVNRCEAECNIFREQYRLLDEELTRIIQRVNLFEKIKIPEAQDAIRIIRIHLGDEMTAAVGRSKIAKSKLAEKRNTPIAEELGE